MTIMVKKKVFGRIPLMEKLYNVTIKTECGRECINGIAAQVIYFALENLKTGKCPELGFTLMLVPGICGLFSKILNQIQIRYTMI